MDQRLAQLDRRARQGDAAAAHQRVIERLRRGQLDPSRLRLAAYLGDPGARAMLPDAARPREPYELPERALQDEVVTPLLWFCQRIASSPDRATAAARGRATPEETRAALEACALGSLRGRREALGWADAFLSGLGSPRGSDQLRLWLWLKDLPMVDRTVHTRAGLACVLYAWSLLRPVTRDRLGDSPIAPVATVAHWACAPSPARAALAKRMAPPSPWWHPVAEDRFNQALSLLASSFDPLPGGVVLESLVRALFDALDPGDRRRRHFPDNPWSPFPWVLAGVESSVRVGLQEAVRAMLVPWAIGERDPLADWLAGRPLPWPAGLPSPLARRSA